MKKLMNKLRQYRSLIIPSITALLSLLWLIFEPSFEPVIVFIAALSTSLILYNQIKNDWTQRTNNYVYKIQIRSSIPKQIDACVNNILESEPSILKWKIYHHDGEFKDLILESIEKLNVEAIPNIAWQNKCKPYSVSLENKILWETEAI
jgi:hypothetical protein